MFDSLEKFVTTFFLFAGALGSAATRETTSEKGLRWSINMDIDLTIIYRLDIIFDTYIFNHFFHI